MNRQSLIERLTAELGPSSVLTGERLQLRQTRDWSDAVAVEPIALLLPRNTGEVSIALRICHEHGCPVAVQGGLTGLAGGSNPMEGEVALSLVNLDAIEDIDAVAGTALVQSGVTLENLQLRCADLGWTFPLDLGARGSCQLGGNAATNGGGSRVLRYLQRYATGVRRISRLVQGEARSYAEQTASFLSFDTAPPKSSRRTNFHPSSGVFFLLEQDGTLSRKKLTTGALDLHIELLTKVRQPTAKLRSLMAQQLWEKGCSGRVVQAFLGQLCA